MKYKRLLFVLVLCALLCAALLGCSSVPVPAVTTSPAPSPTAAPTPTPAPTPVPTPAPPQNLSAGDAVTVDGTLLSGSVVLDGLTCIPLEEAVTALGSALSRDGDDFSFLWRGKTVSIALHETTLRYGEATCTLATPVFQYDNKVYAPAEDFCSALEIGVFRDAEYNHLYCTPGAGNWSLTEGRTVPVLMYHSMSAVWNGNEALVVRPPKFREQMEMMVAQGYQFIWFEDLAELDKYDKPIILTFDDGYRDNYTELLPVLEEFNAKATYFIITRTMDYGHGKYLSREDILSCLDSGLVSIQSHTVNHNYLSQKTEDDLIYELEQSRLELTRLTGKQPFVLSYPCGNTDALVYERTPEFYRFAVKMKGPLWVTGENPIEIYRVPVYKGISAERLQRWLDGTNKLK